MVGSRNKYYPESFGIKYYHSMLGSAWATFGAYAIMMIFLFTWSKILSYPLQNEKNVILSDIIGSFQLYYC
jgi:ABC-type polysaccharide/polyol phosphate export permease